MKHAFKFTQKPRNITCELIVSLHENNTFCIKRILFVKNPSWQCDVFEEHTIFSCTKETGWLMVFQHIFPFMMDIKWVKMYW